MAIFHPELAALNFKKLMQKIDEPIDIEILRPTNLYKDDMDYGYAISFKKSRNLLEHEED